jgi:hypothetical protein
VDELASLDLDDLRALTEVLQGARVSEFQLGNLVLKFHSPEGDVFVTAKAPMDVLPPKAPPGYVDLLGGNLPSWPKAE